MLDARSPREYDSAHVPGSINVTMVESAVGTRAAWVIDAESEVVALAPSAGDARRLASLLEAVGYRWLRGYLLGGISAWQDAGLPIETTEAVDVPTLAERLRAGSVVLLDVRENDEWEKGHVEGSLHVPYHELRGGAPEALRAEADGRPLVVACSAGNRSSIAASLLKRAGIGPVEHVVDGGVADLEELGLDLVRAAG